MHINSKLTSVLYVTCHNWASIQIHRGWLTFRWRSMMNVCANSITQPKKMSIYSVLFGMYNVDICKWYMFLCEWTTAQMLMKWCVGKRIKSNRALISDARSIYKSLHLFSFIFVFDAVLRIFFFIYMKLCPIFDAVFSTMLEKCGKHFFFSRPLRLNIRLFWWIQGKKCVFSSSYTHQTIEEVLLCARKKNGNFECAHNIRKCVDLNDIIMRWKCDATEKHTEKLSLECVM